MAEQVEAEIPCGDYQSWLAEPDESCKDFIMQQTMMRIKDPKASLDFYTRILGMRYVLGRCFNTVSMIVVLFQSPQAVGFSLDEVFALLYGIREG